MKKITIDMKKNTEHKLRHKKNRLYLNYPDKPFYTRLDLPKNEKDAVKYYRDLKYPQHVWNYNLKSSRPQTDCDMINGYLRGTINKQNFTKEEITILNSLCNYLDKAISKTNIEKPTYVYRGMTWYNEFDNKYKFKNKFIDKGYVSTSKSLTKAKRYAKLSPSGYYLILVIILMPGDKALFIDNVEQEYLLPRHNKYKISGIDTIGKTKYYYLQKINK